MQSIVLQAIDTWERHWNETQDAAATALKAAFPHLHDCPRYVGPRQLRKATRRVRANIAWPFGSDLSAVALRRGGGPGPVFG